VRRSSIEVSIDQEMAEERKRPWRDRGRVEPVVGDYERRRRRGRRRGAARRDDMPGVPSLDPATEVDSIRSAWGTISYCDNCGCILVP
jgi:hypothetical protein